MSTIGINIKKIRSVKGLNQTAFANLFGLTRANIGSYEELRAEPKIDTIIKIATHYKIPIDKLVRKELTVNEISNFDIFSKVPSYHTEKQPKGIKLVNQNDLKDYPKLKKDTKYLSNLQSINLPIQHIKAKNIIIFNEGNTLFSGKDSFYHGDFLYLEAIENKTSSFLGVIVDAEQFHKGLITIHKNKISIQPLNNNNDKREILYTDQLEIWEIKGKFTTEISHENTLVTQLKNIEERLRKIEQEK
ncbi:MAG: helix-turn-helix domain-containing protein [Flavobacteriales bacterium]|jgi:transcriptional regulator with XRE-family HTH domain|nr:helix-turn-helix domain-containing protein [Flavobacteriales bacterium]